MKRSSRLRGAAKLSGSVHQELNMYALAASAAGVGMLALAQPAEAKIIYTPAHRHVPLNGHLGIDLTRDHVANFYIARNSGSYEKSNCCVVYFTSLGAAGVSGNGVVGLHEPGPLVHSFNVVSALDAGQQISSGVQFVSGGGMAKRSRADAGSWRCTGLWNNAKNRYLGLKFEIKGQVHYGWARLNESCNQDGERGSGVEALLTGYAYETIPGKAIKAGQKKEADDPTNSPDMMNPDDPGPGASMSAPFPGKQPVSLGMLALGAQGVPLWHRTEEVETVKYGRVASAN